MARLTLVVVLVVAAVAAATVDWRFWKRWYTMPTDPGEWPASYYQPTVTVPGAARPFFPEGPATIAPRALAEAADWAEKHNSAALIVLHRGTIQLERYWQGMTSDQLFSGRAMTRSFLGPLVGIALASGAIASLDDRVGDYIVQWRDDPRGDVTLRQLLHNTSGLENPPLAGDPSPFAKNARISLGSDFMRAARSFELANEPGSFFALSNANAQLLGGVLEAATGESYEDYFQRALWGPLGAGSSELYVDRPGGMPAVYCCFRATPRDWLRFGAALLADGVADGNRIWPEGWVRDMTRGSNANPNYGFQLWVGNPPGAMRPYVQGTEFGVRHGEPIASDSVFFLEGGGYRTLYVLPDRELVILRLGYAHDDWETSVIPNLILAGIESAADTDPVQPEAD